MIMVLCVLTAWVLLCVLLVGLELIVLRILEHASDGSQAKATNEDISDQARKLATLDLAMDETVGRQASELADTFGAQLKDKVSLAPRDPIPLSHSATTTVRPTGHKPAL